MALRRRLIIVRHTQTNDNLEGRSSSQANVLLNTAGLRQAEEVAKRIANEHDDICGVIGSDLMRAQHLGRLIAARVGMKYQPLRDLREVDLGRLTRKTENEFSPPYDKMKDLRTKPILDFTGVGGESGTNVVLRHLRALSNTSMLFDIYRGEYPKAKTATLVVVGHGTSLRLTFGDHLGSIAKLHDQGDFQCVPWPDEIS